MLAALSVLYEPTKPLYCFMVLNVQYFFQMHTDERQGSHGHGNPGKVMEI